MDLATRDSVFREIGSIDQIRSMIAVAAPATDLGRLPYAGPFITPSSAILREPSSIRDRQNLTSTAACQIVSVIEQVPAAPRVPCDLAGCAS